VIEKRRRAEGYALFTTAIGTCAVAWSRRGLVAIQLPDATEAATREGLLAKVILPDEGGSEEPPAGVKASIARIIRHLEGEPGSLARVVLDLEGTPPFHRKVYEAARRIAPGEIRSYGELAAEAGSPRASRAVGQAMAKNPLPIVVPCHRVIASNGKPGGFTAYGGLDTKARLLAIEGATLNLRD
jgi:methylated-DNA-[protein]-cysteine S-methyltransferase